MLVLQAVKSVRDAELTLSLIISQMQEIASTLPEYSVVNEMKGVAGDSIMAVLWWLLQELMLHRMNPELL